VKQGTGGPLVVLQVVLGCRMPACRCFRLPALRHPPRPPPAFHRPTWSAEPWPAPPLPASYRFHVLSGETRNQEHRSSPGLSRGPTPLDERARIVVRPPRNRVDTRYKPAHDGLAAGYREMRDYRSPVREGRSSIWRSLDRAWNWGPNTSGKNLTERTRQIITTRLIWWAESPDWSGTKCQVRTTRRRWPGEGFVRWGGGCG
jgi:hypothetical protein